MELSARPQLKGEERRDGKSWSLEHMPGEASGPKGGCSSIHRYLSSSHGEAGVSVTASTEGPVLQPRTSGRCFRKQVATRRFDSRYW